MKYELTQDKREEIIGAFECQITDDVVNNARGFDVIEASIEIRREDVIKKFDPNDWNEYPDVKPPEDIQMRCITQTGMGFMLRYVKGDWLDNRNDIYDENGLEGAVTLFRPWE